MKDAIFEISNQIRSAWRYRWYAMVVAWAVAVGGWSWVFAMNDQYESSAKVFVDTENLLRPLLKGIAVQTDLNQRLNLMTRTLLSRKNLEKVLRESDLDHSVKNLEERELLIKQLQEKIAIGHERRQDFYTIAYTYKDPYVAKKVVETLLNIFVESALGDTRIESDSAQRFLEKQIQEYEKRLVEAESRLTEFKRRNLDTLPSQSGDAFNRLQRTQAQLEDLQLELKEASIKRNELKRQYQAAEKDAEAKQAAGGVILGSPNAQRIQRMESRLDELLLKYTEAHPSVRELRDTIKQLKVAEDVVISSGDGTSTLAADTAVEQLKLAYRQAEVELTSTRVRVKEYEKRIKALKEKLSFLPKVEAELKRLDRDYHINKKNYEELVQRLESARMSVQADVAGDSVKFRIVEPPKVPLVPVGPKRIPFSIGILVLALGLGGGLAFIMGQLRPVYYDVVGLRRGTEVPVLGQVTRVWTRKLAVKRKLEVSGFFTATTMLFLLFVSLLVIYQMGYRDELVGLIKGVVSA
jgi:polysaccharide chain length determinant protein (PEP-CTERM system associated)